MRGCTPELHIETEKKKKKILSTRDWGAGVQQEEVQRGRETDREREREKERESRKKMETPREIDMRVFGPYLTSIPCGSCQPRDGETGNLRPAQSLSPYHTHTHTRAHTHTYIHTTYACSEKDNTIAHLSTTNTCFTTSSTGTTFELSTTSTTASRLLLLTLLDS